MHRGGGHGHDVGADGRGGAHLLGHREGALEELVQVAPSVPASSAWRTASFIWPRIWGSPITMESSPLATRNTWRMASRWGKVYK
jgi:hypothetical protein